MRHFIAALLLFGSGAMAQEHFSGLGNTLHTGILRGSINPAEFSNLSSEYEVNLFGLSVKAANNKASISDLSGDDDFGDIMFRGNDPVNFLVDAEILGPGFAMRYGKWGFGVTSRATAKMQLVDVDVELGDAISNSSSNSDVPTTVLSNRGNQRLNGTVWGEVGFSASRILYDTEDHQLSAGLTLKILFPGSYANFGAGKFQGTINHDAETLTNTQASLHIAYSGNLGEDFADAGDYLSSVFGSPNGLGVDLGVNYRLKAADSTGYRVNAGAAIRNIGSMTFKADNNSDTNYQLTIQGADALDLNLFDDTTSLEEIEQILLESGYLNRTQNMARDFKVKLPTTFVAYADVRVVPKFYVSLLTQQRLNDRADNKQVPVENVTTLTPRFSLSWFEVFSPWSVNEISGLTGGLGLRMGVFYMGSGSAFTALSGDAKQADFYMGFRFGLK
jgi:hypothetical protein